MSDIIAFIVCGIVVALFLFGLGFIVGLCQGANMIEDEALKRGFATFKVDKNRKVSIVWKDKV